MEDEELGGAWYLGDCIDEDTCLANDLFVNAWMPLPKPYRRMKKMGNDKNCNTCRYHDEECVIARRVKSFETLQQTRITVDDTDETGNRP